MEYTPSDIQRIIKEESLANIEEITSPVLVRRLCLIGGHVKDGLVSLNVQSIEHPLVIAAIRGE